MNTKILFYCIFLTATIAGCHQAKVSPKQDPDNPTCKIKERLQHPFGTLLKMKVEIVDGESLNDKYHASDFLLKIKSVDSIPVPDTIIMEFRDETDKFPHDVFELYKYLYGKETGELSPDVIEKMKKEYVGHEFDIVAYETGEFRGVPSDYYKYQPERQDFSFHFNNYLVIVGDLTKK